ncbi:hypothetical protein JOF29_004383 [Kribbella aluminosa]|uniref:Uncharacterized protein n=1 Tax=Kribbella aluminosa TaxID=416017 RepID=A0ABS4UNS8_9ACTN|nr:hypothetical protein [Kribbella aluminosa]MBP2353273.1 hypothetical protein [Kribbella aluminosa]
MLKLPLSDYWKNKPYKPTDPAIVARVSAMPLPDDDAIETLALVLGFGDDLDRQA